MAKVDEAVKATGRSRPAVLAAITSVVLLVGPITAGFEGERLKPYKDPVGVWTVCRGETAIPMREYSHGECAAIQRARMETDTAPTVLVAVPGLIDHLGPFSSSTDFLYNVGQLRNTSMGRAFRAGKWAEGCEGFLLYRFARDRRTNKMVELPGLVKRRRCERALCLEDWAAAKRLCPGDVKVPQSAKVAA
jgi:lysozyme